MAKQPESRLQKRIQLALRKEVGGWWTKFWGGPFSAAGVPDLIGSVHGLFFALEVKLPRSSSKPSDIQLDTIKKIVMQGGGVATVVRSPEEAIYVVNTALAEAARSFGVRSAKERSRLAMRAENRKDLHHHSVAEEAGRRRTRVRSSRRAADQ